jgi:2,4-dienoyl-CoA reductase-like NADH-dependent reductase (Old Yellow Enzyme family)
MTDRSTPRPARLTDAVHAEGALVSAQIGHAGPVANTRRTAPQAWLTPSTRMISPPGSWAGPRRHPRRHRRGHRLRTPAARSAVACRVRRVEIHLGHNYLLSSFLSPNLNRRRDEYGGSRSRTVPASPAGSSPRCALAVGPSVAVLAKLNMADGVGGGPVARREPAVRALLEEDGQLDALELTGGSSLLNGMYFFRGDVPIRSSSLRGRRHSVGPASACMGHKHPPELPVRGGVLPPVRPPVPRRELDHAVDPARRHQRARDRSTAPSREGFEFVAMARALLREPDLIQPDARAASIASAVRALQQVHAHHLQRAPAACSRPRPTRRLGPMKRLSGRVAVVTGAGSGIGRATAIALAERGCAIAAVDVHPDGAEETAEQVRSLGVLASAHLADVRDADRMNELPTEVEGFARSVPDPGQQRRGDRRRRVHR